MVDLEQKVIVKWNNANKKHYISLGYYFTKIGDIFLCESQRFTEILFNQNCCAM